VRPVWTVEEVRAAEASSGVAEAGLIDRASTAVARRAAAMLDGTYGRRVLVVAGPGHNGADALWAGVKLAARGVAVDVAMPYGEPRDEHGRAPLRLLGSRPARGTYDLVIDGLLGVGARPGPVDWPWQGRVLAVDVPTGVDAATGAVSEGAVRAEVTVTFGALKPGLVTGAGATHAGLVEVAPIGLTGDATTWVTDSADVAPYVTAPVAETDKYRRGVVGVVAGSERYPGAAMLACRGAQRAGCGYVRLLAPRAVADAVRAAYPEVVAAERGGDLPHADVWVVGPGLGDDKDAVRAVLAAGTPVVVDADAIALVDRDALRPDVVLTPHTGEFERLTGVARADTEADRLGHARRAAGDLGCVVLLKGRATVVAAPDGTAYVNPTGTPYLGTAGTGDVLSGVLGALLSRGADPARAAAAAAWLHGLAGRLAAGDPAVAVTAIDVAEALPEAARVALRAC
jgi:ADP-dependent NAD(P)H-hydrate dehydratase / NAD(P)H-hydrate epimerase